MIHSDIDSRPEGASLSSDIVIVGGGPAGITLANTLNKRAVRVLLLESGGIAFEPEAAKLNKGLQTGKPAFGVDYCRVRGLGGSTAHWGGFCAPLQGYDFEKRDWVPHSGWPIQLADLNEYYVRAAQLLKLVDYPNEEVRRNEMPLRPEVLESCYMRFSNPPMNFGQAFQKDLESSQNIDVVLNATATRIQADQFGRITSIEISSKGGRRFRVFGKAFVLACGALENARLLLQSQGRGEKGIGNSHDVVGRYYCDHPSVLSGLILFTSDAGIPKIYRPANLFEKGFMCTISPTAQIMARDRLVGVGLSIQNLSLRTWRRPAFAENDMVWQDLYEALPEIDERSSRRRAELPKGEWAPFSIWNNLEQAPDPNNRLTLTDQLDSNECPVPKVHWTIGQQERYSLRRTHEILAMELGRSKSGRLRLTAGDDRGWRTIYGGCHFMGTTRMGMDPKVSVVDKNCRVHEFKNLFIAGSGVFTTAGRVPPTFTIVALSMRLAEHLGRVFEG